MKKILITGADSYIGTSLEKYLNENYPMQYTVDTVDMIDDGWREKNFSGYDSVFHVAGIAHSDNGKVDEKKAELYYSVNTNLTIETAKKAKAEGAKQFIFMSSIIVYGDSAPIGKEKIITRETPVSPANCYGDSKLQAENGLKKIMDDKFKVVILRPPMIYGKGHKGNYSLLSKIAKVTPIFPYIKNERSMIYIDNLCEFVRLMIENEEKGIFYPQNSEYSNTSEIVRMIAHVCDKNVIIVKGFTPMLKIASKFTGLVNKAFGNLAYEKDMSRYKDNYLVVDTLEKSIFYTES